MGFFDFFKRKSTKVRGQVPDGFKPDDFENRDDPYGQHGKAHKRIRRMTEAIGFPSSNLDEGTEFDDKFFKKIGQDETLDLPPELLERSQRLSVLLHRKNPRAKRAVELQIDFILGTGFKVIAADPTVQSLFDKHMTLNNWDMKSEEKFRSMILTGEALWPVARITDGGIVKMSSISPMKIDRVIRDPNDAEELISVVFNKHKNALHEDEKDTVAIMRRDENGVMEGNGFYFTLNRVIGATRGVPDLLASMDWLEGLDGFVFSVMERGVISQDVVYDLEIKGGSPKTVRKEAEEFITSLRAGGVFAHNEKIALEILVPKLGAADSEKAANIVIKQIQAGTGIPGMFFGDSEDLTRASASELSIPVAKQFARRQSFYKDMLKMVFDFQLQVGRARGTIEGGINEAYKIMMPKIFLRDMSTVTKPLIELGVSLDAAVRNRWVSPEEAAETYRMVLEQLGVDFDTNFFTAESDLEVPDETQDDLDEIVDMMNRLGKEALNKIAEVTGPIA